MKSHRCLICMELKETTNVVTPCMHKVCYDCLSLWAAQSGRVCPICRTPFDASFTLSESGSVEPVIHEKEPLNMKASQFAQPQGTGQWACDLRKRWQRLHDRVWDCLQDLAITDRVIVPVVMQTLASSYSKENAVGKLTEVLGDGFPALVFIDNVLGIPCYERTVALERPFDPICDPGS